MPSIQLVNYRCTDASFTGVLRNFKISAKNSGHGVNFGTTFKFSGISEQRPGLWMFAVSEPSDSTLSYQTFVYNVKDFVTKTY